MAWEHSVLVSEVYDMDLPVGHTVGDVEFHLRAIEGIKGKVLEPATGNGRVLIPLLEAGHDAEGLDHSPDMLDVCRANCRARGFNPVLHMGSMRTFVRPGEYAAVIMPAGSIRNLAGRDEAVGSLHCFYRSLVPEGRLVIDLVAPRPVVAPGPWMHWARGSLVWTKQLVQADYDPVENRTTTYVRYEKWNDGALLTTELHRYCLQHWGVEAFGRLLNEAGFEILDVCADYVEGAAPTSASGDWTFRAIRQ